MADQYSRTLSMVRWLTAQSAKTFENRNPANRDDLIGLFPASGAEDVDAAVQAAKKAFAQLATCAGAETGRAPLSGR